MERITKIYLVENIEPGTNKVYIGKTIDSRKSAHKSTYGSQISYTYIDEVLDRKKLDQSTELLDTIEDGFHSSSFLAQVNHPQLADIPMLSQIARQEAIWPQHTTEKREKSSERSS
jgi:hypothetical protein